MTYEPDVILFGSNDGAGPFVHFWRRDNPEWDRLSMMPVRGESLIRAGFTGFECQDALADWKRSPAGARWSSDNAAFLAANPGASIHDLRAWRRAWWRDVMGR